MEPAWSRVVGVIPAGGSGWLSAVSALLYFQLDCSTYELERLHTKVTSLCNRIEQIQCHNARDRLAQSDMAKRIANLLRVVLSLQHSPEPLADGSPELHRVPLRLLAPHVGRLPMPEDYALEELRGLTQSYLRELTVVTQ
ncbi:nuclear pore complex protein Nup98-Nup96-like [Phasianus colchicus]|uniref:nuclear pore complex protein Nup98-Nup96-like n=1 Tax=Phasianus colchicus TaxID=9054 RepID=UPI00129D698B|nr:nuclear pore complex protein Nup98-Nup96-like [Phasianus colchicus]